MYMDHRIISKISKVLARLDMSVMLLDGNGLVILPEDDPRVLALPEALLKNPTQPMVYGGVTLIGVLIANGKTQAVTETKLEELTREVRLHNNFAQRVPVIEEQLKVANHRIADLEEHEYERERN